MSAAGETPLCVVECGRRVEPSRVEWDAPVCYACMPPGPGPQRRKDDPDYMPPTPVIGGREEIEEAVKTHAPSRMGPCEVCWHVAWSPVPADDPNAQEIVRGPMAGTFARCDYCWVHSALLALKAENARLAAEVERLQRSAKSWEADALRYFQQGEVAASENARLEAERDHWQGRFELDTSGLKGTIGELHERLSARPLADPTETLAEEYRELLEASKGLCMWIRHILPEWDSEVQLYLDKTLAAIEKVEHVSKIRWQQ